MKLLISLTPHAQQLVYTSLFIFFKMGIFPGKFFSWKKQSLPEFNKILHWLQQLYPWKTHNFYSFFTGLVFFYYRKEWSMLFSNSLYLCLDEFNISVFWGMQFFFFGFSRPSFTLGGQLLHPECFVWPTHHLLTPFAIKYTSTANIVKFGFRKCQTSDPMTACLLFFSNILWL